MIRSLVPSILLFLLPFALYFLWLGRQRRRSGNAELKADRRHLAWALGLAIALAAGGFVIFTDFSGATPDEVYVPPEYKDGKLVPGHFIPRTKAP
jgi:hypothetical protein